MKLKIEIDPNAEEEIVIKVKKASDELGRLESGISSLISKQSELAVRSGDKECFISFSEVLYAEVSDDRVYVHTSDNAYLYPLRLYELEMLLPKYFVRSSKSCLINVSLVRYLSRTPTGVGEAGFAGTNKKVFISRMYFKIVRDKIEEMRLSR